MNVDSDDMDLGLALGYSNQSVETRLNNNSGAGVNAGSVVDMAFVASNPLSELVWSPHKGLSLKCAEKPFLWHVGPSNMILSPADSIRSVGTNVDKPINEKNLITWRPDFHGDSEVAKVDSLAITPRSSGDPVFGSSHEHHRGTGCNMEEADTVEEKSVVHFNQEQEEKNLCSPKNIQLGNIADTSGTNAGEDNRGTTDFLKLVTNESRPDNRERITNSGRIEGVASGSQTLGLEIALASEAHTVRQCVALDELDSNLPSQGKRQTELALIIRESKSKIETHGGPLLEKLESTAENDVQHLIVKDACKQDEEIPQRNKSVQIEASSTDSRIDLHKRKGKEKVLSDRDVNERMSNEDDSHESMESCNSAVLFSKGKKRWRFEQPLIAERKKIKKQIQESPVSSPLVGQDSSFMNWISNMVKGLPKSNKDAGPSLALTLDHLNNGLECHDKKIITCDDTRDSVGKNMGFQTIFQSLYCPNSKVQKTRMSNEDYPLGGSKEVVLAIGNINNSTSESGGGPVIQTRIMYANMDTTQETCKTNSAENKTLTNLAYDKGKDRVISSDSSLGKQMTESADNNNFDHPSDGKVSHSKGYRSDPLGNLWITRFSMKTCSTDNSSEGQVNVVGRELQNEGPSTEASIGFKRVRGHNYQESMFRKNPGLSSQTFKISEAMASVFARRLGALKHIVSSSIVKTDMTGTRAICFFCGKSGHYLRDCSEVNDAEVEDLLRNISSYDGAGEYSCLCIRCFHLDHWANTCTVGSSKKRRMCTDGSFDLTRSAKMFSDNRVSSLEEVQKHVASRSGDDELKENQITHKFVSKQISDTPKGMFDTIRKLRFSRTDILKWMNSHNSPPDLDGFFLRLRLGKSEGGHGGTGYSVACITGVQREKLTKNSKNVIGVSIGGVKCLVESKYVSNNDFTEDELTAWWHVTLRSGKIPTKDELKSKLEERRNLGV